MGFDPMPVTVDALGALITTRKDRGSVFGTAISDSINPQIQMDSVYGIIPDDHKTFTDGSSGSAGVSGRVFQVTTGTSVGGYGTILSRRSFRFRPGQGAAIRFSAAFTTGVANSLQIAGGFTAKDAVVFGYDGANFGAMERTAGEIEIRQLQITAAASGSETVTLTLNGTAYTCAVTSASVETNAYQIAADPDFTSEWDAFQTGDTITFIYLGVGSKNGTYSVSSTGTMTGTFSQVRAGVDATNSWTAQSSWSVDVFDGSGGSTNPSGMNLDPTKLNLYEVSYGYGAANVTWSVYNPATERFHVAHIDADANTNTTPSIQNPSFTVGWAAASLGSTTNLTLTGADAMAYIVGRQKSAADPRGTITTKTGIGTSFLDLITIRCRGEFGGIVNQRQIIPDLISVSVDGTKPAEVLVVHWYDHEDHMNIGTSNFSYVDESSSIVEVALNASNSLTTSTTGARVIAAKGVSKTGDVAIKLRPMMVRLGPRECLTLAVRATSSTTEATCSMTWSED